MSQYEYEKTKSLMMLPTGIVLIQDEKFKKWTEMYARDNNFFFKNLAPVVLRLFELDAPFDDTENQPWVMKPSWDESA